MAKTINFEYKNTNYVLEFSRDTIKQMEKAGFSFAEAEAKPMSSLLTLFRGAFIKNHPRTSQTVIDEIWEGMGNKDGLFEALAEMYNETLEVLFNEPEEGKKIKWTMR